MNICVFCSSSNAVDPTFFSAARRLGKMMAQRGDTLVYGGADIGLMGTIAEAVKTGGGSVVGVMPTVLQKMRIVFSDADEFIVTQDMRERKAIMETRADAFVVLPGGFGTLEELAEILTLRQIGVHAKPIVILNTADYYAPLVALFEHFYAQRFSQPWRHLYYIASEVPEIFDYLDTYQPDATPDKQTALEETK
jgi:cytokinin riboside 5'-monophosphate phosphoribohydrolase